MNYYKYFGDSSRGTLSSDAKDYKDLVESAKVLKFTQEELEDIHALLAAILHLGTCVCLICVRPCLSVTSLASD